MNGYVPPYRVWFDGLNDIHISHTPNEVPRAVKNHIAHSRSLISRHDAVRSHPHPLHLFQKKTSQRVIADGGDEDRCRGLSMEL
jgi:hypothetical protein